MFYDEVMETGTSTGTTAYALGGAPAGSAKVTWRSKVATTGVVLYCAKSKDGTKWEIGYGPLTWGSPDQIGRTLLASSTGALINWQASDVTAGYYIYSAPIALVWAALLLGTGFTTRPAWAQTGLRWPDWNAGIGTRIIDKLFNGTTDVELGRYEGVPGIYIPSPRHYWVDQGAASYTVTTNDVGKAQLFNVTAANRTCTLPAGSTAGHGFRFAVYGYGGSNGIVLTPNGSDPIDTGAGGATLTIPGQRLVWIEWNGAKSQWQTDYVALPGASPPQGRLTLASATPVMTAAQTAKTVVYYTPYVGNQVPLYDGSSTFNMATFAELSNDLTQSATGKAGPAAATTNSNYDFFVWDDAGTKRLTRGPLWTSDTARGTGAGTTELQRVNGIWTNKVAITNGPAAGMGTYVGTIRTDGSSQANWNPTPAAAAGGA